MKDLLSELFGYTIASAPTTALKIVQENGKVFETRLSLNVLLIAPFGVGKSSFLEAVEQKGYGVKVDEYTLPAVVGTIKKSGEIIEGFVVKSAGRVLLIDEFQKFGKREKEALLSLMEDHRYTRTLGYKIAPPIKRIEEYYSLIGEDNYFTLRVRNAYIIATMEFKRRTIEEKALLSRTIPVVLNLDLMTAMGILTHGSAFELPGDVDKWYQKTNNGVVTVQPDVSKILQNEYRRLIEETALELGYVVRGMMDILRIAGIIALIHGRTEITEEDIYQALKFAPIQIMGFNLGALTPAELEVYSLIVKNPNGIRQSEIIKKSSYSRRAVIDALSVLLGAKMIRQLRIGKAVYYKPVIAGGEER